MLQAYFQRIGYTGPRLPDLATLNGIIAAHVQTIPFENLDVLLGRPMSLEPEALLQKLVRQRRGGYCFEQNGLLLEVLRMLDFEVVPLSARVRLQHTRDFTPPRTHMFLQVTIDGEPWLADVGVGGLSPAAALAMNSPLPQATPHELRRLLREGNLTFHQVELGGDWQDVSEFTHEKMPRIDREVAHWFTATSPASHFRNRLLVARAGPNGTRHTILNHEYSERAASGHATKQRSHRPMSCFACSTKSLAWSSGPARSFPARGLRGHRWFRRDLLRRSIKGPPLPRFL